MLHQRCAENGRPVRGDQAHRPARQLPLITPLLVLALDACDIESSSAVNLAPHQPHTGTDPLVRKCVISRQTKWHHRFIIEANTSGKGR